MRSLRAGYQPNRAVEPAPNLLLDVSSPDFLPFPPSLQPIFFRNAPITLDKPITPILSLGLGQEADLIKLDIINEVVNRTGITKTKAEMAVETVFESMKRSLGRGERIELRGFGIFNVRPRKTGIGRNPRTGAEVAIPPGKAVRFKPGKELQTLE